MSIKSIFIVSLISVFFVACKSDKKNESVVVIEKENILDNRVLSREEQEKLTPQQVLNILKRGNEDFKNDNLTVRNNTERIRNAALSQYPKAVVLSCLDSRVPVEDVFHRGIGDVFVARVAGNVVNEDILGSLEFACKVSGSKLILVLGHEYCGAIKSAIDDVKLGNITSLLSKIQPAVNTARNNFSGEMSSKNPEFVEAVCHHNIEHAIQEIRNQSPILREMETNGEIMIAGGVYDMETGEVEFFN